MVPNGISYNSYAILDEKITIMDSVDAGYYFTKYNTFDYNLFKSFRKCNTFIKKSYGLLKQKGIFYNNSYSKKGGNDIDISQ